MGARFAPPTRLSIRDVMAKTVNSQARTHNFHPTDNEPSSSSSSSSSNITGLSTKTSRLLRQLFFDHFRPRALLGNFLSKKESAISGSLSNVANSSGLIWAWESSPQLIVNPKHRKRAKYAQGWLSRGSELVDRT